MYSTLLKFSYWFLSRPSPSFYRFECIIEDAKPKTRISKVIRFKTGHPIAYDIEMVEFSFTISKEESKEFLARLIKEDNIVIPH